MSLNSVNWCDIHRAQFPCDNQCPQCVEKLRLEILQEVKTKWDVATCSFDEWLQRAVE